MSLPIVAKIGLAGALAAGIPVSYIVLENYLSLSEVEKSVLSESVSLEIAEEDTGAKVTATTTVAVPNSENTFYKWECKIIAEGITQSNKGKFKTYLEGKLPNSTTSTQEDKKTNKDKLVWECSKDRKGLEGDIYKSELKLTVTSPGDETNISTELFGPKASTTTSQ